jgi:hypothetical protein
MSRMSRDERERLLGVSGLQNERVALQLSEQRGEAIAHDGMIVDDQEFHAPDYGTPRSLRTRGRRSRQPQWS